MFGANSHYVRSEHRMTEDFLHAIFAQHDLQDLPALGRDLVDIGVVAVALLDVCLFKSVDRGNGVILRIAGKTPCADRCSDQVNRAGEPRNDVFQDDPVDLAEHQPFRPT